MVRLKSRGSRIKGWSEGEIAELHIGFTGTMSALYLKSLGEKTWRGKAGACGPESLAAAIAMATT